eukprot:9337792-Lingulodinium_polyedra.AAC.1
MAPWEAPLERRLGASRAPAGRLPGPPGEGRNCRYLQQKTVPHSAPHSVPPSARHFVRRFARRRGGTSGGTRGRCVAAAGVCDVVAVTVCMRNKRP